MTFFYDLNKKLDEIRATPSKTHGQLNERDMGKHNNATTGFAALAKKAGKEYGSKAAGERVAGAVKAKMAKAGKLEEQDMDESAFQAAIGKKKYGDEGMKALQKAGRDHASDATMKNIRNKYDKYDEGIGDVAKKVGSMAKKVGGKVLDKLGHGSDEDLLRDLQKKAGIPAHAQHGKKSMAQPNEGVDKQEFAALAPPKDKITFADKIAGAKKEVDERLGDVAAEAIKGALSPKQKKIDMNKNGKLDANDFAMLRKGGKQETDEGWDDMIKDVDRRRGQMKTGEKTQGHKGEIEKTATGIRHTRRYDAKTGETDTGDDTPAQGEKRGRGRPKKAGGPSQERVTAKSRKADRTTWQKKVKEGDNEGDDVKQAMAVLKKAGYKVSKAADGAEELDEKAVSKKQQKFMGMVHATQKGEKAPSKEVAKVAKTMKKKDAEDFASTKHKGLPEKKKPEGKKKEKTEEAGGTGTPTASSGFSFGKGIYDSMNHELENMIKESMSRLDESMSINMSDSTEGGKSLTITASDEDAIKLATLLKSAGLGGGEGSGPDGSMEHEAGEGEMGGGSVKDELLSKLNAIQNGEGYGGSGYKSACGCDEPDCGCGSEEMDEAYGDNVVSQNSPDYPTNQETAEDNFEYSGGLNKPKSTGQSTTPVLASQEERQMTYEADLQRIRDIAGIKEAKKVEEDDVEEGNKFTGNLAKARADGKKEADLDGDGDMEKVRESIFSLTNQWKAYKG